MGSTSRAAGAREVALGVREVRQEAGMRHIAITGASSGIGAALAREFSRAGDKVTLALVARRRDLLEALAKELGPTCHVAPADLSNPEVVCDWIPAAEAALGPIDVLVNNAGVELISRYEQMDIDAAERLFRLNLHTPLRLTHAVLPGMLARRRGTIVDVASVAALAPAKGYAVYAASKAGLAAAGDALRSELKGTGVHVVTVFPGPIRTDMGAKAVAALEESPWVERAPWGTSEALARLVRKAVEKRRARVIYPRTYALAAWFPDLARWLTHVFAPAPRARAAAPAVPVA
jgi:short-subunit dehydrogenase